MAALCCLASFEVNAKIIETQHVEDVISLIDEETWFLVDLDNCLFQSAQALGHANWFYDLLKDRTQQGMERNEAIADFYPEWIKTQKACRVKPVESSFITVLSSLQDKGITIMGLTHRQPLVADSTMKQVASLGVSFLATAPSKDSFVLPAATPTLYAQGILFAGDYNRKIDIFNPFLVKIGKQPKKVVFIDDQRKNVDELEALAEYGIEYIGVHYTAVQHTAPVYSREIAEFQYKFLDQIMSNEAALLLMEKGLD